MSRPTSERAKRARDWAALRRAIDDEQRDDSNDQHRCLHALQKMLEGRDPSELLALLDAGLSTSRVLAPVLAEVIRDLLQGRSNGRPAKLFEADHVRIRQQYDGLTSTPPGMTAGQARQILADRNGVSPDTVRRSLAKTAGTA